jgi:hypothetical protein
MSIVEVPPAVLEHKQDTLSTTVTCDELLRAYVASDPADEGTVEPLWLIDPVRYRSPYAQVVPHALIQRR